MTRSQTPARTVTTAEPKIHDGQAPVVEQLVGELRRFRPDSDRGGLDEEEEREHRAHPECPRPDVNQPQDQDVHLVDPRVPIVERAAGQRIGR